MGYKVIDIRISVHDQDQDLKRIITRKTGLKNFTYQIIRKSLDARNKKRISWQLRLGIISEEIPTGDTPPIEYPEFPDKKCNKHVVIIGMGPAGLFAALYLLQSGCRVTIIDRGSKVEKRKLSIDRFESERIFDPANNYAFGEGGAGTFSDGKLTSRTKNISRERNFIFKHFVDAGAPWEIFYLTHPHIGSDNLYRIAQSLRKKLTGMGCNLLFETRFTGLKVRNNRVIGIDTSTGLIDADVVLVATGHSAYDTYRILIDSDVPFHPKNFALGFRVEHRQEIINVAQWGIPSICGVKAAEYRLTCSPDKDTTVYSFCMCPGGTVVPAAAMEKTNIVNGMSRFMRNNQFANAAIVAGFNIEKHLKREVSAKEALEWLEKLENFYYSFTGGYDVPACSIRDFIAGKQTQSLPRSSFPFDLITADFSELLPAEIIAPLKKGLTAFNNRLKGYETGIILGLESKTSSPIQTTRHPEKLWSGFENLFIAGEASGRAGGIISSAADGLKIAQKIIS